MSHVVADLEDLDIGGLVMSGAITPRFGCLGQEAVGRSSDRAEHDVELVRPAGVPVRVRIGGGSSKLAIDSDSGRTAKADWRSPDYDLIEDR